jgi:phenylpyruvate tautomerase PptA (4-oxalocrotonate tautomerase family)
MDEPAQAIQIPLTPEQQALIKRLSGQFAQVLELVPDTGDGASGQGRGLQFRWRLSVTSGIPRQNWGPGGQSAAPPEGEPPA